MALDDNRGPDEIAHRDLLEALPIAVTVSDLKGRLLYFNAHAARILDRKPSYLGTDIRRYHRRAESNAKIDGLLDDFAAGRRDRFAYRAVRYGRVLDVVFTPLVSDGRVVGVVQTAVEVSADHAPGQQAAEPS